MKLAFAILLVFSCPLLSSQTWDLDDWIIPFCEDDFSCGNGECIDLAFLCNGDLDCENGADEANCFGDLKNPKTGKQLDLSPEPIDSSNDLCSSCTYLCNVDSVRKWCSCPEHYELASDQRSCLPTASGYLVLSTGSRLFRFYPLWQSSDSFSEIPLPPNILITDLVVNMALNEIYLHDGVTNRLGLLDMKRADLDDQWNTLVDSDLGHVSGLGFDSTTRTLYWIDSDKGTLEVVDTRSRHRATLKRELDQPISITVVEKQAIYIGLGGSLPSIISVSFDGIITRRVIASKVGKPVALSTTILDSSRLFWADAKLHKIDVVRIGDQRFLSSTGDQEQKSWLLEGEHMHNISSMVTFGEKIFWTVSHLGDIFSASLKNGQQYEHQSEFPIPTGSINSQIRLVPVITRSISDESTTLECNTQCNHLCLFDSKHRNITCHCSDGYYSPDNGVTCIPEHVFSVKEDKTNKNTLSETLSSSSSKIMISKWVPWVAVGLSALFFIGVCLGLFWKIRKMHENSRWKAMLIQQHRQNSNNSDGNNNTINNNKTVVEPQTCKV